MCYDDQARPPIPPGEGRPASGEDLVLTSADGTRFMAYAAHPANPDGAQVLIYPDVRGLHQFYKELALRFAEMGYPALAIDYFGRTAGISGRDETFEFMPHVGQLKMDSFWQDVSAGLAYMRSNLGGDRPVFVVGFCMGGSFTLISGTQQDFGFTGLIPFYAGMSRDFGGYGTVLDHAHEVIYPVLGLFGGNDPGIPESNVRELEDKLNKAGVQNEIVIYPGAPHSFFDRRATEFAEASTDAWERIQKFISSKATH